MNPHPSTDEERALRRERASRVRTHASNPDAHRRILSKAVDLLREVTVPGKRIEDIPTGRAWKFMEKCYRNREYCKSLAASASLHFHFNPPPGSQVKTDPSCLISELFSWPFDDADTERFERELLQAINPTPTTP